MRLERDVRQRQERVVRALEPRRVHHQRVADAQRVVQLGRAKRRSAQPPEIDGHAAHQQRVDKPGQVRTSRALHAQDHKLARSRMVLLIDWMRHHRRVDAPGPHPRLVAHDDRKRRMVLGNRRARQDCAGLLDRIGRHRDERHHAAARMGLSLFAGLGARERMAHAIQGVEDVGDGDVLAMPVEPWLRRHCGHGLCHSRPSASSSLPAAAGPHVPAS